VKTATRYKVLQGKTTVAYVLEGATGGTLVTPVSLRGEPLAELISKLELGSVPDGMVLRKAP
jgi:hypothetical protein